MYVHWRDCGTPLYPLLGLGTHYTAYESELQLPSGSLSVSGFSTAFMAATLWLPVYGLVAVAAIAAPKALRRGAPDEARAGWVVRASAASVAEYVPHFPLAAGPSLFAQRCRVFSALEL
jgi:hypothetical protein